MNLIGTMNLYVGLSVAQPVDAIASWKDPNGGEGGGNIIHITNTAPVIVIPAIGSGNGLRRMTDLNLRALAANYSAVTVTIYQSADGINLFEVMSGLLKPADILTYDHQAGFKLTAQALLGNAMADIYQQINPQLLL